MREEKLFHEDSSQVSKEIFDCVAGRAMMFGTFDIFHLGHQHLIEQALFCLKNTHLDLGERYSPQKLFVVVARDKTVKSHKPSLKHPENQRLKTLKTRFPHVTSLLGDKDDPMLVIRQYRPEYIYLGYDQYHFVDMLKKTFPFLKIKRLKAYFPEFYKSSFFKST